MPIVIDGTNYRSATEVLRQLNVSRQTLWRWRQEGRVPAGHRYRNGQVVFTDDEFEAIRVHANRVEPIQPDSTGQLSLFQSAS